MRQANCKLTATLPDDQQRAPSSTKQPCCAQRNRTFRIRSNQDGSDGHCLTAEVKEDGYINVTSASVNKQKTLLMKWVLHSCSRNSLYSRSSPEPCKVGTAGEWPKVTKPSNFKDRSLSTVPHHLVISKNSEMRVLQAVPRA